MDLFQILWTGFSLDDCSVNELIEISSLIDAERSKSGCLKGQTGNAVLVASTVVALINSKSIGEIGEKLDCAIKELIVKKNFTKVDTNNGRKIYKELQLKKYPGTYMVKKVNTGYKFELVASNGEVLAVSEVYMTIESCLNGIKATKKIADAHIEDSTVENNQTIKNPKYRIYCDRAGEYRFMLSAMNGQVIMASSGYSSKEKCIQVIDKIRLSAVTDDVEKI